MQSSETDPGRSQSVLHQPSKDTGAMKERPKEATGCHCPCLKPTEALSGGETARLLFCRFMLERPNVLLLDELTNHLDLESINALHIALQSYDGTVLLVTHDQDLLEEVGTRVWPFDDGRIVDFKGSYEETSWAIATLTPPRSWMRSAMASTSSICSSPCLSITGEADRTSGRPPVSDVFVQGMELLSTATANGDGNGPAVG